MFNEEPHGETLVIFVEAEPLLLVNYHLVTKEVHGWMYRLTTLLLVLTIWLLIGKFFVLVAVY